MNHNSESEISVHGYEDHESYSRIIVYENSMNDIKDIIRSSTECRQFIKVRLQLFEINLKLIMFQRI